MVNTQYKEMQSRTLYFCYLFYLRVERAARVAAWGLRFAGVKRGLAKGYSRGRQRAMDPKSGEFGPQYLFGKFEPPKFPSTY